LNHLESSFSGKNSFWIYILMFAIILIVSNTIGSFPSIITIAIKSVSNPEILSRLLANPNDFSVLGLEPNIGLIMMLSPSIAGLAAFILLVKPLNHRTLKITINGTGKIRWNRFFISAFIWLILAALYFFMNLKLDPANFTLNNKTTSLIVLSVISLLFIPFQAAFEEVLFRGYLMQGFAAMLRNRWFPLVMTSILFGLIHSFNPEVREYGFFTMMPQYILFGLIFGVITILDDGIEAAMGAHAANNVFICIMVTNESSALQAPALFEQHNIYPWAEFTGIIFTGITFLLILKIIFRWNDFSLLFGEVKAEKIVNQIP
jgi:membrane protease YdiL (CAAX protease family)